MCSHCLGLRQNIHGPSDCVLPHGHVGDCSKTAFDGLTPSQESIVAQWERAQREARRIPIPQPPATPWFVPVIAGLLPAKTAREMPRPLEVKISFDKSGRPLYNGDTFNIARVVEFMAAINKGEF